MTAIKLTSQTRQTIIWIAALLLGALLGLAGKEWINSSADFIAAIYTRLFQFLAVPTIALAVVVTLANFGSQKDTGKIFRHTITYTLLTTVAATLVGLALYLIIQPDNLSAQLIQKSAAPEIAGGESLSYKEHLLSAIPNNVVRPFLEGNVLSILLLAFAVGIALAKTPASDNKEALMKVITALQDLLFRLIRGLIWALPLGIVAFAAQLSAQVTAGCRLHRQVCGCGAGRQRDSGSRRPASLPLGTRHQSAQGAQGHVSGATDGALHQIVGCHIARHDVVG